MIVLMHVTYEIWKEFHIHKCWLADFANLFSAFLFSCFSPDPYNGNASSNHIVGSSWQDAKEHFVQSFR